MTYAADVERVRRELWKQRLDAWANSASWAVIVAAIVGVLTVLVVAAAAGRLTP